MLSCSEASRGYSRVFSKYRKTNDKQSVMNERQEVGMEKVLHVGGKCEKKSRLVIASQ